MGVPDGVTITESTLVAPSGNTIVESLALNGAGDLVITLKDSLDKSINQGVIAFQFAFEPPQSGTGYRDVTWEVAGEPATARIIVKDPADQLRHAG